MKHILVVDDEPVVRALIAASLASDDCEVVPAADGCQALAALSQAQPDLILLDVGLPGMSGLELLRQLRSESETATIPVLLLTGFEPPEDVQSDGVLRKPFTPSLLRESVAGWI